MRSGGAAASDCVSGQGEANVGQIVDENPIAGCRRRLIPEPVRVKETVVINRAGADEQPGIELIGAGGGKVNRVNGHSRASTGIIRATIGSDRDEDRTRGVANRKIRAKRA